MESGKLTRRFACDIFEQMEISWLGHACFRIRGGQNNVVITDPYAPNLGYSPGELTARIVTVSHQHPGHSYVQGITGKPRVIAGPGEYEISDVFILGLATYHDDEQGKLRGKNTVYVIEVEGMLICHLGDLGHILTPGQAEEIDNVDILLLPVGGVSTIDAAIAAQVVRQLEPKIVIPMHFRTPAVLDSQLEPVDRFLKEIGGKEIGAQPRLSITKLALPASMQVILLDYPH